MFLFKTQLDLGVSNTKKSTGFLFYNPKLHYRGLELGLESDTDVNLIVYFFCSQHKGNYAMGITYCEKYRVTISLLDSVFYANSTITCIFGGYYW